MKGCNTASVGRACAKNARRRAGTGEIKRIQPGANRKKLASAENIAVIKQGGSVSEALDLSMSPDATATVINPDGSVIENFDANLAHAGDTVARNADGSITVFKTSEVAVREGQSLAGVYRQIESVLNREKIPNEIKEVFNNGKGHWGGRIDRSEANRILEWWHDNKDGFGKMPPDAQKEFLSGLKGAHSKDELDRLLNEALSGAEGAKESAAPVAEAVAVEKAPLELPKEHDAALNEAVHNPEIRIESEDWPPKDSRSVWKKFLPMHWDQDSKANERAGVTENVVFDSKAKVFAIKSLKFSIIKIIPNWKTLKSGAKLKLNKRAM